MYFWPSPAENKECWRSEDGQEYINKHFSIGKVQHYCRTRSPVGTADIDRDLITHLFSGDDKDFHYLIRDELSLPYIFGDFHPSHLEEYASGLLLALQKPASAGDSIHPILCGETWHRCHGFASLAVNSVRGDAAKIFTSTYENFIQTAGIPDGASHCDRLLGVIYDNLTPLADPNDPELLIKIDITNAFNTVFLFLTLDCVSGTASRDYACGLKNGNRIESSCDPRRVMFSYFQSVRTCNSTLRYYDWFGKVHISAYYCAG